LPPQNKSGALSTAFCICFFVDSGQPLFSGQNLLLVAGEKRSTKNGFWADSTAFCFWFLVKSGS